MIKNDQLKQLLAVVHTLDDQGLALLEKTLDEYIRIDANNRELLIEKKRQVQSLRAAIQKQDEAQIAEIRKKLAVE